MKQLLLATATLVGMSAAALAAEPVALTDSQLDNVTAGANVALFGFPAAISNGAIAAGAGAVAIGAGASAANPLQQVQVFP